MKQEKLIKLRHALGFSQQEMADMLGITKGAYSLKENGKRNFNQQEIGIIFTKFSHLKTSLNMQDIFLF
jgi:transcriptional regulator with XRE-family HTH domain